MEEQDKNEALQQHYDNIKDNEDYKMQNRLRAKEWYDRHKNDPHYIEKRRLKTREYMRRQFEENTEAGKKMRDRAVLRYWKNKKETCDPETYKRAIIMLEHRSPERAAMVVEQIGY